MNAKTAFDLDGEAMEHIRYGFQGAAVSFVQPALAFALVLIERAVRILPDL